MNTIYEALPERRKNEFNSAVLLCDKNINTGIGHPYKTYIQ